MMRTMNEALNGGGKPFTSVSVYIDRLSSQAYKEDDLDGIPELVEAINIQSTGPAEASRQLRKKLKYGSIHGQKRAITMLGALVENAGPRFQSSFADPQLVERIKLMSQDPLVDASVRRKLMRMLLWWSNQFKNEPNMRTIAGLYSACGGGRKSDAQMKSEAAEAFKKRREADERERQVRMDRKAAERLQREEEARQAKEKKKRGGSARPAFNFEKEKPIILSTLATSQQSATSLVNALQHVNREKESVVENMRVQQYLSRVKAERKKVVRYIQLVRDEEFLGGLISANDQIILSLELYDKLAKSPDRDSEDEAEPLANIRGGKTAAQRAQERAQQEEDEIAIVQQRLAAAHIEESQLDALQDKQRQRIERHNSYRSSRTGTTTSSNAGGSGHMNDLLDLSFDDEDSRPPHAVMRPSNSSKATTTSSSATSAPRGDPSLSDYSEYESESDDDAVAVAGAGIQGRPGQALGAQENAYDDDDLYSNHQPSIGPESILDYSLEAEGDDDPFADPQEAQHTGGSAALGLHRNRGGPRQDYAAV
jgi:hypothetical protein